MNPAACHFSLISFLFLPPPWFSVLYPSPSVFCPSSFSLHPAFFLIVSKSSLFLPSVSFCNCLHLCCKLTTRSYKCCLPLSHFLLHFPRLSSLSCVILFPSFILRHLFSPPICRCCHGLSGNSFSVLTLLPLETY